MVHVASLLEARHGRLEQGAAENALEVTFSGVEDYAEEYVERIFTGNGDEAALPR